MRTRSLVVAGIVVASLGWVAAQAPPPAPIATKVSPQRLRMQPEDALTFEGTTINVFGDPEKPGLYAIRRRFKPGEMSRPHTHDQDRLVTVIKGTWWTGEGNRFTPDRTVAVKTGGFMLHPKGLAHYDGAKDEEVIVQIIGMGPVTTTQVEVDAAGRRVQP